MTELIRTSLLISFGELIDIASANDTAPLIVPLKVRMHFFDVFRLKESAQNSLRIQI